MKRKNILHWPTAYPDADRNQPYHCIFVEEHIRSLSRYCNNRVLFISPESTQSNKWHERTDKVENGIRVTRFYFNKKLNSTFLNFYIRLIILVYFIDLIYIKRYKPDIMHIHFFTAGTWALLFSKLLNIKMVVTEHWTALVGYPVIPQKRFDEAKKVYTHSKWVLPVSTHLQQGITKSARVDITPFSSVVHNSVNTAIFHYTHTPIKNNQLLSVVRLDEQKDIPTMLKAVQLVKQHIPDVHLNIIGSGDAKPFKTLAKELNIEQHVNFLGPQPKEVIALYMNRSALFILSSIAENSPCVIGESHCCGLPVVVTDVGGVKELVMEGDVVEARKPELLAEKIVVWLNKTINRKSLSQEAQNKFSYKAIGNQIHQIYEKVCAA